MPLIHGASRRSVGENIATELRSGRKPSQAKAIALSEARRASKFLAVDENDLFVAGFTVDPLHSPVAYKRLNETVVRRLNRGGSKMVRLLDQERREVTRWRMSRGGKIVAGR